VRFRPVPRPGPGRHGSPSRRRVGRAVGLAAALLMAGGVVLAAASPAYAHAALVASSPANGAELDAPPAEVRLRFTERVTVAPDGVTLRNADGVVVETPPAATAPEDPTTVVLPVPADLPQGSYVVVYRVVSEDSHPVAGALAFGVGVAAQPLDEDDLPGGDPAVSAVFAAARWTSYAGLGLLAGSLAVFVLCWPGGWANRRARLLVGAGWVASLAGGIAVLLLQGPYGSGRPLSDLTDPRLLQATLDTDYGRYVVARLAVVAAAAALVVAPVRRPARWQLVGALAVAVAMPVTWVGTGHANAADNPLDPVMDVAHLVAMSTWFSGLVLLVACVLPRSSPVPAEETVPMLRRYSLLATGAVVTLVVTGTYVAWRRLGTLEALFGTPYGRLLAFKLAGMAVLLWLGALSRSVVERRYAVDVPGPEEEVAGATRSRRRAARAAREQERLARRQLGVSVRLEALVVVAVLAVASVLVATPPGVVVTAPQALAAERPQPVLAEASMGTQGTVAVLVDPAMVGANRLVVEVFDANGDVWDVPEVRASFQLPDGDLGPLPVELIRTAPGVFESPAATVPVSGDWKLNVSVRTTEIDVATVQFDVPVT
jgi:copper transport protein